jgi:hypothetical protein
MAKFSGEQRPELQYAPPHRFAGDIETALGEQIFDVAMETSNVIGAGPKALARIFRRAACTSSSSSSHSAGATADCQPT